MLLKPTHVGIEYAAQFKDTSIVEAYHHRPPYPAEVFEILADLITDEPRAVLDAGCGTGVIARHMLDVVERIDAVDFSEAMIETGRSLPGGDHPKLNWILGRVEDVSLRPPYALVTAGSSFHWLDWEAALRRFHDVLTPRGYLAMIYPEGLPSPWDAEVASRRIIPRFSTNREYQPYDLFEELEKRSLFRKEGERRTRPMPFAQSIDNYVESFHSMNGFSRERMAPKMAAAFDAELKELVSRFCPDGTVALQIVGVVTWGKPGRP